jgi:tellurite resistance protein
VVCPTGFFVFIPKPLHMPDRRPSPSVQHLNFAWFAMVMGLCGLSLAWMRAVPHWSGALQVSMVVGVAAVVVFFLLLVATVWRGFR